MKTKILLIILLMTCSFAHAYPIFQMTGTVEGIYVSQIVIDGVTFQASGFTPLPPKWVKKDLEVSISYACNELGDCFYIDIVKPNATMPIMDKINQELLSFEKVYP